MNQYIYVRPRDDGQGWAVDVYDGRRAWAKTEAEPWAVITYTDEPSPETGHVGWVWWALGEMGDAPTYEAACTAAVAEMQRRMDDRMAIL